MKDSPRLTRRRALGGSLAVAGLGALSAAGCGSSSAGPASSATKPAAAGAPRGEITMALVTLADQSTDPHVTRVANLAPITTSCFEQFSRWGPGGTLIPALASSMEESPDHLKLVFHLRPDATFWDGSPVTAEDAKWSFERYISLAPGDTYQAPMRALIDSVTAPDPHTVAVSMKTPSTLRLSFGIINPQGWNIASRAHYEHVGEDAFRRAPMCTGPFRLVANELLQSTSLEAYAGHYERVPHVKSITMKIVPELQARLAQLQTGEAGFVDGITGPARVALDGKGGIGLFESTSAALATLYFHEPERPPYNDIRFRQALRFATDQAGLTRALLAGAGSASPPAHVFPVTRGYDPAVFPAQEFDPERAKALLTEAGLSGRTSITAWSYDSSSAPQIPAMMQAVAGMWSDVGVDVHLETLEAGTYLQRYSIHGLGGIAPLASGAWFDGEALLRTDYLAGQPFAAPMPAEISAGIERLGQEFDEGARVAGIQAVYRQIMDGAWNVTLPWATAAWAIRKDRVASWQPSRSWAYPHAFETLVPAGAS